MFGMGTSELLLVLALVLVAFGAGKLPEIGGMLGHGIWDFRRPLSEKEAIDVTSPNDDGAC